VKEPNLLSVPSELSPLRPACSQIPDPLRGCVDVAYILGVRGDYWLDTSVALRCWKNVTGPRFCTNR